jgi:hypothetical protein
MNKQTMKKLLSAALAMALTGVAFAQDLSDQFQEADAELNRVYKELRSLLNEEQKAALKKVQIAWLKEKERLVKKEYTTEEQLFTEVNLTIQRTKELKDSLSKMQSVIGSSALGEDSENDQLSDKEASRLLVGKWAFYNGSKYETTFIFKSDGSFNQEIVIQKAGECNRYTGTWRIENGCLILSRREDSNFSSAEIRFSGRNCFSIEEETFDREM